MKHLLLAPILIFLILFTASCSDSPTSSTGTITTNNTPALAQPTPLSETMAIGSFQEYPLPQSDSGMMRPAIDHEGRIWFGEMNNNFLAYFDPRTHTFKQMIPPRENSVSWVYRLLRMIPSGSRNSTPIISGIMFQPPDNTISIHCPRSQCQTQIMPAKR